MKELLNWHDLFKGARMLTCAALGYLTVLGYRQATRSYFKCVLAVHSVGMATFTRLV